MAGAAWHEPQIVPRVFLDTRHSSPATFMGLINFILNLAGLLLWLGWRDQRAGALTANPSIPLARTLSRLGAPKFTRWKYLGGLALLLVLRAVFYYWIGPVVRWTPHLQLGAIAPSFPSEHFWRMELFSVFSFGLTLVAFYLSLLMISVVNRRVADEEPLQKFVRGCLGRVERWPLVIKLLLPLAGAVVLWMLLSPLFVRLGMIPPVPALGIRFRQGLLVGVGLCLVWKHVLGGLLLLHFLNNYVYLGHHAVLSFAAVTSRRILAPFQRLPLRIGRMDFTPVFVMVLIYLLSELVTFWLPRIYPA